jgi:hypothetical protein
MTAQMPDLIIYEGKESNLHTNPMNVYFAKYPDKHPYRIDKMADWGCEALHRGYVATFEIKDDQLWLKEINVRTCSRSFRSLYEYVRYGFARPSWKNVMHEIFPNQNCVKVDWFTGTLILPSGKLVEYVHMDYASTYEYYTLLELENGDLKSVKQCGHADYKEKYKEKFWCGR